MTFGLTVRGMTFGLTTRGFLCRGVTFNAMIATQKKQDIKAAAKIMTNACFVTHKSLTSRLVPMTTLKGPATNESIVILTTLLSESNHYI